MVLQMAVIGVSVILFSNGSSFTAPVLSIMTNTPEIITVNGIVSIVINADESL